MKNWLLILLAVSCLAIVAFYGSKSPGQKNLQLATITENEITSEGNEEEKDGYSGPYERGMLEIYKTRDPATGTVPVERLFLAMKQADEFKSQFNVANRTEAVAWVERGPISDVVGSSNGNSRGQLIGSAPNTVTSGRIRAVLIDANDPSGNTVWTGGVAGGLWKTTNFLSASPTWTVVNDFFSNLAISSICQSPANANHMYFATGEPTANSDAVLGAGIWRSLDGGNNWTQLANTNIGAFRQIFKVLCDASGNVYAALRGNGLHRSTNQGVNWTNIIPAAAPFGSCTDIEISSTGRLHASFGYNLGSGQIAAGVFYTDIPATVTTAAGWNQGTGLPVAINTGNRIELACLGNTVYAAPTTGGNVPYAIYRSTNGGATWTKQNAVDFTSGQLAAQGWYNLSLGINPNNANDVTVGALDAYRSLDAGATFTRATYWVGAGVYAHADHHEVIYRTVGGENRILMATDGGLFLSRDGGVTFADKNVGLRVKQFYSAILHPNSTTNPNYMIGGTQDNGTHQINASGLTSSVEVTGGDGAYVDITAAAPSTHWGAYVFRSYRLSNDNGANWGGVNYSDAGRFINPFVYDGVNNILYAAAGIGVGTHNQFQRVTNANNASRLSNLISVPGMDQPSALKLSPYTANRLYIGSGPGSYSATGGRLFRIDDAHSTPIATNISGTGWSTAWYLNCVNVGTSDNNLVATFTNYGINGNIWVTTDGGTNWTNEEGNLPDIPVRWALFAPGDNTKMVIATEAGVYTTNLLNGGSTVWIPSPTFPTVRTDMLQLRAMDNAIVAATHGRGIWTGNILNVLPLNNLELAGSLQTDGRAALNWTASDPTPDVRYRIQYSTDGIDFRQIGETGHNQLSFKHLLMAPVGYYRIMGVEPNRNPIFSNTVQIRTNISPKNLFVTATPNLVKTTTRVEINGVTGSYNWQLVAMDGRTVRTGKGNSTPGTTVIFNLNTEGLVSGMYRLVVWNERSKHTAAIIKQ